MRLPDPEPDDTASIRLAASQPCAVLVVGALPELTSRRGELALAGFDLVPVATAAAALARQKQNPCSVVLVAHYLADSAGSALIASIRASPNDFYVYLILQCGAGQCAHPDVDDWIAVSATHDELMKRLRAAQRIVTLERICRLENESARIGARIDQVSGAYSRQFLTSEAVRILGRLQCTNQAVALILVRLGGCGLSPENLAGIVDTLFAAASSGADVVARLSADDFGLLIAEVDERTTMRMQAQIIQQLSRLRLSLLCGMAVLRGPIIEPKSALQALILSAEQQLRSIEPATSAERVSAARV